VALSKPLWARPVPDPELPETLRYVVREPGGQTGLRRRRLQRQLAREIDRVVYPHDLDLPGRLLLARAQNAIDAILGSHVRAADLLEADEAALRRHEWDIACTARELTAVRALPAGHAAEGAMTAAVQASQQRALSVAHNATDRRVSALERLAAQVDAADSAHRDWQSAVVLAGLNDRYTDLVARTAADELAVTEIDAMADYARITAQALRESLREAGLAAEELTLPAPRRVG
jgi:hypothetical protein